MHDGALGEVVLGTVILAAGQSSRMGRPKLLLPWGDSTVLGHLIGVWQQLKAKQIAFVVDPSNVPVSQELDRLHFASANRISNPEPDRGMFSSIRCAAAWPGWELELSHYIVVLGDQPQLRTNTLRRLLAFGAANPSKICQPRYDGRSRHPILLPKSAFSQIRNDPAGDMKEFLVEQAAMCAGLDAMDPGLELDLDTPADYERMRTLYFPEK